jgi:DNA polymerase (family 10)
MSLNDDVGDLFATLATLMELRGESVFKAIAFSKVGRLVRESGVDLKRCAAEGTLCDIEGIGESSRQVIEEFVRTGRSTALEELSASVPAGLLPMLKIPGLGPKTIRLFWKERGIVNMEQLVAALENGSLEGLKGVGEKKLAGIRQGIAMQAQAAGRVGIVYAVPIAQGLLERVRQIPQVQMADIAGSLRRKRETIGDVDVVCALEPGAPADAGSTVTAAFVKFPEVERILGQGNTKASVVTAGGIQVDLRIVPADSYGAALLYFTGSKEHNVKLRGLALEQDLTLNEWGLYPLEAHSKSKKKTGSPAPISALAGKTEIEVYERLGLAYIAPELREDRGEIDAAKARTLPTLIEIGDINGDLHTHTTASDGTNSIEEMADAAVAKGYKFYGIADHSKSQVIANGLSAERLLKHIKAIHKANDRYRGEIHLLASCEVDILVDGRLDFEDAILAELDYVVASPHISLKQDETKATDRMKRAIENPYVKIIGHPTGRLIDRRPGLPLKFEKLFPLAAKHGVAMEINAGYPRLDLNDLQARAAIAAGVMLSINTDAHSTGELDAMVYGVNVARRAWASSANVINCMSWAGLQKFLLRKK